MLFVQHLIDFLFVGYRGVGLMLLVFESDEGEADMNRADARKSVVRGAE